MTSPRKQMPKCKYTKKELKAEIVRLEKEAYEEECAKLKQRNPKEVMGIEEFNERKREAYEKSFLRESIVEIKASQRESSGIIRYIIFILGMLLTLNLIQFFRS